MPRYVLDSGPRTVWEYINVLRSVMDFPKFDIRPYTPGFRDLESPDWS